MAHATTLIVGSPGRWLDSLRVLLEADPAVVGQVRQAHDAPGGLALLAAVDPALVVLDAALPAAAWDVLAHLRRDRPHARCLVITHTLQQERQARAAGAHAILPAGFDAESLYAAIRILLQGA